MNDEVAFFLWAAYLMGALLCFGELLTLALRYRNIRAHLGRRH